MDVEYASATGEDKASGIESGPNNVAAASTESLFGG